MASRHEHAERDDGSDHPPDVTRLLVHARNGDGAAVRAVLPIIYDELRALAGAYFERERDDHTLQPTAVIHEAYIRMVDQNRSHWNDRAHFFRMAAKIMRQILIEHARKHGTAKRGGGRLGVTLQADMVPDERKSLDVLDLNEAMTELASHDERKAQVVELRFFGDLSASEIADALGISVATVERDWLMARAWLKRWLKTHSAE